MFSFKKTFSYAFPPVKNSWARVIDLNRDLHANESYHVISNVSQKKETTPKTLKASSLILKKTTLMWNISETEAACDTLFFQE